MPSQTKIDYAMEARVDAILAMVRAEVLAAAYKHAPMNSPHEGHSVIREEFEELWDHVKADTAQTHGAMDEAVQIAAMGVRFVLDLSSGYIPETDASNDGAPAAIAFVDGDEAASTPIHH